MRKTTNGFTIVELLIVIVVIAVLAAITIVAYNGIQARANQSKMQADLSQIKKAILAARVNDDKLLRNITGIAAGEVSSDACDGKTSGTDIGALPHTDTCFTNYDNALNKISISSGMNIRNIYDPYGRPYIIYEAEGRSSTTPCDKDFVASLKNPHVKWGTDNFMPISNYLSGC